MSTDGNNDNQEKVKENRDAIIDAVAEGKALLADDIPPQELSQRFSAWANSLTSESKAIVLGYTDKLAAPEAGADSQEGSREEITSRVDEIINAYGEGTPVEQGGPNLAEKIRLRLLRTITDDLLPRIEKNEGFSSQPKTEGDEEHSSQLQEVVNKLLNMYEQGGPTPTEKTNPDFFRIIREELSPIYERDEGQPSQVQKVMNELLNTYSAAGLQAYTGYTARQMFAELSPKIAEAWLKCVDARLVEYTDIDTCQLGLALMSGLPESRWDELITKAEMGIISSFSIEKHFSFPKKRYWNDIMKAGLANVKGGASTVPRPAECVQECCEEILKAAGKAEVPTKEALGLVVEALDAGAIQCSEESKAGEAQEFQKAREHFKDRMESLSGPSGGGGGGGGETNYAGNLNPPKEARAGAGWTL